MGSATWQSSPHWPRPILFSHNERSFSTSLPIAIAVAMASPHVSQKIPAGLAGVLNKPDEHRDSAYYSSKDASSKHNSTQSTNGAPNLVSLELTLRLRLI